MRLSGLRIGVRIALGFGAVVTLMLAVAATAVIEFAQVHEEDQLLPADRLPTLERAGTLSESVLDSTRHARNALIMDDPEQIKAEVAAPRRMRAERGEILKWLGEHLAGGLDAVNASAASPDRADRRRRRPF